MTGGPGGSSDTYAVVVDRRDVHGGEGPRHAARPHAHVGPAEFLKLITGTSNPAMMFMTGKVKASGDLGLATGLANWFEPQA